MSFLLMFFLIHGELVHHTSHQILASAGKCFMHRHMASILSWESTVLCEVSHRVERIVYEQGTGQISYRGECRLVRRTIPSIALCESITMCILLYSITAWHVTHHKKLPMINSLRSLFCFAQKSCFALASHCFQANISTAKYSRERKKAR